MIFQHSFVALLQPLKLEMFLSMKEGKEFLVLMCRGFVCYTGTHQKKLLTAGSAKPDIKVKS